MAGFYDVGKLVATLGMNTSPFMAGANAATNKMRQMQNSMMMVGRATTRFITIPMALAGGAAVKAQKDFENSMTKIIGLVGISRETVEGWKKEIFDISRETGRGPRELGDALFFVTSAGFRGSEALDILHKSAMAAAGGLGETKNIADLVTSAMYAYRKSNLSATEAMDAVIASVREGKVEVTDLINSMGKVFPIASKFGVSINEVGASFAAMTRSGTEADKASTHLRAILNQMMSPSEKVRKNLSGLAMGADEFQKVLMQDGLIVALMQLNKAIKGDPRSYAEIFQNIRALTGVLDLMGDNMEENIRIFERMKNANGELKKLFEEVQETTQFKLDKALANLGITLIELGEILKDPVINLLTQFTEWIQKISDWLNGMTDAQKKATLQFAGFIAVLGPAALILSRVTMMIAALGSSVGGLAIVLGAAMFAWLKYRDTVGQASRVASIDNDIRKRSNALMAEETTKIKELYKIAKDETLSKENRVAAIKEMQRIAPTYFSHLDAEKTKLQALTDAMEDYTAGTMLKSKVDAITQAIGDARSAIMTREREGPEDQKLYDAAITRIQIFAHNYQRVIGSLGKYDDDRYREKLRYKQVMEDVNNAEIVDLETYLEVLQRMLGDAYKDFVEHQKMMVAARSQRGEVPDEGDAGFIGPMDLELGGHLFRLQQKLRGAQEDALGVSREMLPVALDRVRAADRLYQLAQLQGDEFSEHQRAQNDITALTILQQTAGKRLWGIYENIKKSIQKAAEYTKLQEGGLGVIEQVSWDIENKQEEIANAAEEELEALKNQLRVLREKEAILTEVNNKYREAPLLALKGSEGWKTHYANRIADLKKWLDAEAGTQAQRNAWVVELFNKENDLKQHKLANVAAVLSATANAFNAISQLVEANKQKELSAAGDNAEAREAIEKKYYEKQKRFAISQAIINGALAITQVWATMAAMPILAAIASGIAAAAVAAQIAVISAQSFAQGGLVYGETLAKVGDYPGASSNPEVIAPLSDLKKLLKPQTSMGMPKVIKLVAEGPDLVATIDTELLIRNTY
jgi:TP901 family phage tail tape measure protein